MLGSTCSPDKPLLSAGAPRIVQSDTNVVVLLSLLLSLAVAVCLVSMPRIDGKHGHLVSAQKPSITMPDGELPHALDMKEWFETKRKYEEFCETHPKDRGRGMTLEEQFDAAGYCTQTDGAASLWPYKVDSPNDLNGYDYGTHAFTQTFKELRLSVVVPEGTKSNMVDVRYTKPGLNAKWRNKWLSVGLKGQIPLLQGELQQPIDVDECIWDLTDQRVELILQKKDWAGKSIYWDRVWQND